MSVFTTLGIIVFSALIMALLQLVPGVFSLVQHNTYGKYSRKRASDHSLFFIIGAETSIAATFIIIYLIISAIPGLPQIYSHPLFTWITAGILFAFSVLFFICYYQKGSGCELFISRRLAKGFQLKTKLIKNRSDAFILGALAPVFELLFTLPLYILMAISINAIDISSFARAFIAIIFSLISITPLIIMHGIFPTKNLAHILRFRIQNKTFFKSLITLSYIMIAIIIIMETSK